MQVVAPQAYSREKGENKRKEGQQKPSHDCQYEALNAGIESILNKPEQINLSMQFKKMKHYSFLKNNPYTEMN